MSSGIFKNLPLAAALLLTALSIAGPGVAQDDTGQVSSAPAYLVNPGDVLAIVVWKEADLQRNVIVRPDGKFSFPLVADVQAAGRSVEEIRLDMEQRLARYIPDLVVTVSVEQILGNKIYVIGQVNNPGEFVVSTNVDVVQALSIARGTTAFAQTNDIRILRRENGVQRAIRFRYGDIEAGKRLEQNIVLKPGDIVVVP